MENTLVEISVHNDDLGEYWNHITPEYAAQIQKIQFTLLYRPEPALALFQILLENARNINMIGVEWMKAMEDELCQLIENNPVEVFKIHRKRIPIATTIRMLELVKHKVHHLVYKLPTIPQDIVRAMDLVSQFDKMTELAVGGEVFSSSLTSTLMGLERLRVLYVGFNDMDISKEMYPLFSAYIPFCYLEKLFLHMGKGTKEAYDSLIRGISNNTSIRNLVVHLSRKPYDIDAYPSLEPLLTIFDNKPFIEEAIFINFFNPEAKNDAVLVEKLKAKITGFKLTITDKYDYIPTSLVFGAVPKENDANHVVLSNTSVYTWTIDNLSRGTKSIKIINFYSLVFFCFFLP